MDIDVTKDGLFRDEAVAAAQPQWLGTVRLALPASQRLWGLIALAIVVLMTLWLFLGHYTRREHVVGRLVPDAGLVRVMARTDGTIASMSVEEGAFVREGQTLLTIDSDHAGQAGNAGTEVARQLRTEQAQWRAGLGQLDQRLAVQADGLRKHIAALGLELTQLGEQVRLQRKRVDTATALVEKVRPLLARGYVSSVEFARYQAQVLEQKQQLKALRRQRVELMAQRHDLRAQLQKLPFDTAAARQQLRVKLAQVGVSLAQNAVARAVVLNAPVSGLVSAVLSYPGQAVRPDSELVNILPAHATLQARLFVPSSAIGFVQVGTPVQLHYQAYPYQKFGSQQGVVIRVSRNALTAAKAAELMGQQMPQQPLYRVTVRLKAQTIHAHGALHHLLPGMLVDADLLLDRRRLIDWIFEPLYGVTRRDGGQA